MRLPKLRTCLIIAAAPALAVAIALPATAQPGTATTHVAAPSRQTVILVLRDQNANLPARSAQRRAAVHSEQAPLVAQLNSFGARKIVSTSIVNAVIANVPTSDLAALKANPAVARVLPNATIHGPTPLVADAT